MRRYLRGLSLSALCCALLALPASAVNYLDETGLYTTPAGGGGGSGTVNSGTAGNFAYYATSTTAVSDSGRARPTGAVVGDTDTQTLTNKTITRRAVSVADATSITCDWSTMDICYQANTQTAGVLTVNNPSNSCTDGQVMVLRIRSNAIQTYSWGTQFRFGVEVPRPSSHAGASTTHYLLLICNAGATKVDVLASSTGY